MPRRTPAAPFTPLAALAPLVALALALAGVACSPRLTPMSDDLRRENRWTERELGKIQFYLSEDIVLSRERRAGSTRIQGGRVRVENGRDIEEVVFKRGTPGVALFMPKDDQIAIGFDASRDDRYLMFGSNPKQGGDYTLLAKDWKRYRGDVTYAGEVWQVSASAADVKLLMDIRKQGSTEYKRQSPAGRRVGN